MAYWCREFLLHQAGVADVSCGVQGPRVLIEISRKRHQALPLLLQVVEVLEG